MQNSKRNLPRLGLFALIFCAVALAPAFASAPLPLPDQLAAARAQVARLSALIASRPQITLHPADNLPAILASAKSHADYVLAPGVYRLDRGIALDNVADTTIDFRQAKLMRGLGNGSSTIVVGVNADVTLFGPDFDSDRVLRRSPGLTAGGQIAPPELYTFTGPAASTGKSPWAAVAPGDATSVYRSDIKVGAVGVYVRGRAAIVNPFGRNIDTLLQFAPTCHDCLVDCSGLPPGTPCATDELRGDGIYAGGGSGLVLNFSIIDSWNEHCARVDCDDPAHRTSGWDFIGGKFGPNLKASKEDFAIRNGDNIHLDGCTILHYLRAANGAPGNVTGLRLDGCLFAGLDHAGPQCDMKVGVDSLRVESCTFADDGAMSHLNLNVPMKATLIDNRLAPVAPGVATRPLWNPYPPTAKPQVTEVGTVGAQ